MLLSLSLSDCMVYEVLIGICSLSDFDPMNRKWL